MEISCTLPIKLNRCIGLAIILAVITTLMTACEPKGRPFSTNSEIPSGLTLEVPSTPTAVPFTATPTATPTWPAFSAIADGQVTEVPFQAKQLALSGDIEIWALLGMDKEAPYIGLTNAFHLVLVNARLAKAAVISIPGNLLVYLPGEGMKRLNSAYALGGFNLVRDALIYNFGLPLDRVVLTHPSEFKWFVDDMGGLEVSVLTPIRDDCGGLPAGTHSMDGAKTYCYVAYLDGKDEIDRVRRQQQVLQLLFNKLVQNGRLAMLPILYASYQDKLETDFSLLDVLSKIPLALRLGDIGRVSYRVFGWDLVSEWELPDHSQTSVLLPIQNAMVDLLTKSIAELNQPSPLTELVLTYEAQLTAAVGLTQTAQPFGTQLPSPRVTPAPPYALTHTPTKPLPTGMPGATPTRTIWPTSPAQTPEPYPIVTNPPVSPTNNPYPGN